MWKVSISGDKQELYYLQRRLAEDQIKITENTEGFWLWSWAILKREENTLTLDCLKKTLEIAKNDESLSFILEVIENKFPDNWRTLGLIYDTIVGDIYENDCEGTQEQIFSYIEKNNSWLPIGSLDKFTNTANDYELSGAIGRHGINILSRKKKKKEKLNQRIRPSKGTKYDKKISIEEGISMMRVLMEKWIDHKLKSAV